MHITRSGFLYTFWREFKVHKFKKYFDCIFFYQSFLVFYSIAIYRITLLYLCAVQLTMRISCPI